MFANSRLPRIMLFAAALCAAIVLAAVNSGAARAQQDGVDLALFTRSVGGVGTAFGNRLVVTNYGGETAYGVRVEIEVNSGKDILPDLDQRRSDYLGVIEASNPSQGVVEFNVGGNPSRAVWNVGRLAGRSEHTLELRTRIQEDQYMEVSFDVGNEAPEEPSSALGNNVIEFLVLRPADSTATSGIVFEAGRYSVQATASPQSGGEVIFDIRASLRHVNFEPGIDTYLLDALVETRLTGLGYVSHEVTGGDDSLYVHSGGANNGTLDIGHWKGSGEFLLKLTAEPVAGVSASEQCLTAEISGFPEAPGENGVDARDDNTAKVCLSAGPHPEEETAVLSHGRAELLRLYDCVGNADYPCGSADGVELVVDVGEAAADVGLARYHPIWQPENVVVHVADSPRTRRTKSDGSLVWWSGSDLEFDEHNSSPQAGIVPGVSAKMILPSPDYDSYTFGIADRTPGGKPGSLRMTLANNLSFTILDDDQPSLGPVPISATLFPLLFEFGALGTYVADFTLGGTHQTRSMAYTDPATYTFWVGPAADLEARAADSVLGVGSGQTALTVLAVNNGPDDALGAKVNIDLGLPNGVSVREVVASGGNYDDGVWDLGGLRHSELRRAFGLPEGETLTFILEGNGAESASLTATISHDNENHPYTVCIDADGNDVDAASRAACEPADPNVSFPQWHEGTVYDWKPGNDMVTLGARRDLAEEALPTLVNVEGGPLALHEGGDAGEYTVVLGSRPSHDVRIRVSSDNPDVTVDTDDTTEGNQHTLTFTPVNWPNAQTVYVSAGHDADAVNDTATLTHTASSSDGGFNRVRIATVSVDVDDDEPPEIQVGPLSHSPLNEGESATYIVSLTAPPTRNVPMELVVTDEDGDEPDVTVRPASFTLNRNNWETGRTITATAGEDDDGLDDTVTITHIPSADAAAEYRGKTAEQVVNVLDDDVPGVRVSESVLSLVEGHASNASRTYTVRLNMAPTTADVVIGFASDNPDVTVDPSSLTFTAENSATEQTVTVTVADDPDAQDETAIITGTIRTPTDPDYDGVTVSSITVSVADDETAGITLSPLTPSPVTEGQQGSYTVVLDAQPTADVVINLASDNDGVTVPPTPLTFTTTDWDMPQTVTVTAAEDADSKNETAKVTHAVDDASSADEYDGLSTTQAVSVTDNDVPGLTLTTPADGLQVREGGEATTYTVKLQTEPSANVVVDISSNNGDVTVDPRRLTFTTTDWNTAQTVTVSAGVDSDGNDDQFTLTHRASSSASSEYRQVRDTLAGTVTETAINYDTDDDPDDPGFGLIEIRTAAQLGAVRYDLNGDQKADDSADDAAYKRAFPQAGCEDADGDPIPCSTKGYELVNDITLSGNWTPIGGNQHFDDFSGRKEYQARFYGNGHVIRNLQINRGDGKFIGLFGAVGSRGFIYHVGLENVNVRGRDNVGALVGRNEGRIEYAWSTGRVSGNTFTGGLVGWNRGAISQSYSEADVTGFNASDSGGPLWSTRIAGLVGGNQDTIANSYAMGDVRGRGHVAGLAGENSGGGTIRNSYATGAVSTELDWPHKGGLVGWQQGAVIASYWDTKTTGQDEGVAQGGKSGAVGYTTDELQKPTAPGAKEGDIYFEWDDRDIWYFGTSSDYPCLRGLGGCTDDTVPSPPSKTSLNQRANVALTAADPVAVNEGRDPVAVIEADDAEAGVTVHPTSLSVPEGGSATYTVSLDAQPLGAVGVFMTSLGDSSVTADTSWVTFTPEDWQPRTVTVSAGEDDDTENGEAFIAHALLAASGSGYEGVGTVDGVIVEVLDNDQDTAQQQQAEEPARRTALALGFVPVATLPTELWVI